MAASDNELRRFAAPYDWDAVDDTVHREGGAILRGMLDEDLVRRINDEFDRYFESRPDEGSPHSGSEGFDKFLGHKTRRIQNLPGQIESGSEVVGRADLVAWSERMMAPIATSVVLNSGELIQIGPGESRQPTHRDSDQWPSIFDSEYILQANAILALDPFTEDNGATHVVPGSWEWDRQRRATEEETVRATMDSGDALLIRGEVLHGGGANTTTARRRALSISYCPGWIRPIENNLLNVPPERARDLSPRLRRLLGYELYDGMKMGHGILGVYGNYADPKSVVE